VNYLGGQLEAGLGARYLAGWMKERTEVYATVASPVRRYAILNLITIKTLSE